MFILAYLGKVYLFVCIALLYVHKVYLFICITHFETISLFVIMTLILTRSVCDVLFSLQICTEIEGSVSS